MDDNIQYGPQLNVGERDQIETGVMGVLPNAVFVFFITWELIDGQFYANANSFFPKPVPVDFVANQMRNYAEALETGALGLPE